MNKTLMIKGIGVITPNIQAFNDMKTIGASFPQIIKKDILNIPDPIEIQKKELRQMSKLTRLCIFAAANAIKMTNLKDKHSVGLFLGLTHGSASFLKKFHDYFIDYGADLASPSAFSNGISSAPLSSISSIFQLTDGGTAFTGVENIGIELLNEAAFSIINNEYQSCLAGAAEEFSSIVEDVYRNIGWYNGESPLYLPSCQKRGKRNPGFSISEGSVFFFLESSKKISEGENCYCFFSPIENLFNLRNSFDLIISGAGGGPQDIFELRLLKKVLSIQEKPVPVLFSKPFFDKINPSA